MVRSKSVKRPKMSECGDNATISPPYYFRHCDKESAKPQNLLTLKQNADIEPSIIIRNNWFKGKFKYCTYCLIGILAISLCIILVSMLFPYPLYASCMIKWKFGDPCTYVMQKFRCQIMNWSSWNICRHSGGSCSYTLKIPAEENIIRATHVSSNLRSLEKIKIVFEEMNNTCLAIANSVSSKWFMLFDDGANYCNLHNLVVGAGLDRNMKFVELTSNAVCTQFNMAVCG